MKKTIIIIILFIFLMSSLVSARTYTLDTSNDLTIVDKADGFPVSKEKIKKNAFLYKKKAEREAQLRDDKYTKKNWQRIIKGKIFHGYKRELDAPIRSNVFYKHWINDDKEDFISIKYDEDFGFSESRDRKNFLIVEHRINN